MREIRNFAMTLSLSIASSTLFTASELLADDVQPPTSLAHSSTISDGAEKAVIGKAYDTIFSDTKNNSCVKLKAGLGPLGPPAPAPSVTNNFYRINDVEDYAKKSNISASAAYGWGTGNASASVSYMYSGRTSSYRSLALLESDISYPPQIYNAGDFELTSDALKLVSTNYDAFRLVCGDSFVVGFTRGGRFAAMISVDAETTEEQNSLAAAVDASSVTSSASADLQQTYESKRASGKLQINVTRDALEEALPDFDVKSLIDYSKNYPVKMSSVNAKPIKALRTSDYLQLIIAAGIAAPAASTSTWSKNLTLQFRYLLALTKYKSDLIYIRQHPGQFVGFDDSRVSRQISNVGTTIDAVSAWAVQCLISNGSNCPDPSQYTVPVPGYTPARANPWKTLNPAISNPQLLGSTTSKATVESTGIWQFGNAPQALLAVTGSSEIIMVNQADAADRRVIQGVTSMPAPAGFDVYYRFIDLPDSYGDNHIYAPDPARLRFGGNIDDFVNGN